MSSQSEVYFDRSTDWFNRFNLRYNGDKNMGLNADATNAAEAVRDIVGQQFEILGTSAVSTDAALDSTGGIKLSTHGASADSTILLPHLTAAMSAWTGTLWDTAKSPTYETMVRTGASVAAAQYWIGFKLTNTPTASTDADSAFFAYSSATNSGQWQFLWSIGSTLTTVNVPTSIVAAVAASTSYRLRVEVDADRKVMGYINDVPVMPARSAALTSLTTFIPYVGVKSSATAVKTLTVKYCEASRLY